MPVFLRSLRFLEKVCVPHCKMRRKARAVRSIAQATTLFLFTTASLGQIAPHNPHFSLRNQLSFLFRG